MLALTTTIAFSAQDCCHACRLTEQVLINSFSLILVSHRLTAPRIDRATPDGSTSQSCPGCTEP